MLSPNRDREYACEDERAAKIAAARRGKPRSAHVIEALRRANTGRKASSEARAKMREAHKRRGTYPPAAGKPFTAEEDALLGTMTEKQAAARTGRDFQTISNRRRRLGIPAFRAQAKPRKPIKWTPAKDALLGTVADRRLAKRLQCTETMVRNRRKKMGVAAYESRPERKQEFADRGYRA